MSILIPGGREKGATVASASSDTLKFWAEKAQRDDVRAACAAELKARSSGASVEVAHKSEPRVERVAERQTEIVSTKSIAVEKIDGTYTDHLRATNALKAASETMHLISPAAICPTLPEGCELSLSCVAIDPNKEAYKVPTGDIALTKTALDKIAAAAGVSWSPTNCRRVDDGKDPHYCCYSVAAEVRGLDGQQRVITGSAEIDVRDSSDAARSMQPRQLAELRKFILRHAESKAKLRAIRSLGIRPHYSAEELRKPFCVARLAFTGRSDNPETSALFSRAIAASFLGSTQALFGGHPAAPAQQHYLEEGEQC